MDRLPLVPSSILLAALWLRRPAPLLRSGADGRGGWRRAMSSYWGRRVRLSELRGEWGMALR